MTTDHRQPVHLIIETVRRLSCHSITTAKKLHHSKYGPSMRLQIRHHNLFDIQDSLNDSEIRSLAS